MNRRPVQRITDVLKAVERCQKQVVALDRESDIAEMAEDVIERNLQIIGAHPEISSSQIRGIRNISVHQYFGVNIDALRAVDETHRLPVAEVVREHVATD